MLRWSKGCAAPALAAIALALADGRAVAQERTGERAAAVAGSVVDAVSGLPVPGAMVSLRGEDAGVLTDAAGAFVLRDVPAGARILLVRGFGWADLLVPVTVAAATPPLLLRLEPDPFEIAGLDVTGRAGPGTLTGVVVDAVSGAGLPWAALWLRDARRATADAQGAFRLTGVPQGDRLLLVEQVGYVSQWVPVRVAAPSPPVELRLTPDSAVMRGLATLQRELRGRRNGYPGLAFGYGRDRLARSAARDMVHFLEYETPMVLFPCEGTQVGSYCALRRGRTVEIRVYLDELPILGGIDVLRSYRPGDLYMVEVFGTNTVRAYTHAFMARRALAPRVLLGEW